MRTIRLSDLDFLDAARSAAETPTGPAPMIAKSNVRPETSPGSTDAHSGDGCSLTTC
jgi:hypothetical protein